jgi:iron(III) transport system ATP-binding protein
LSSDAIMAHLQVRELSKSFGGAPVLEGVTLEVQPGELLAILGASGSGKTTLLRLICGFERADGGTIDIDGRIVADARTRLPPEQRRVGYVAQEGALFPHLSVADNIVFGLSRWQRRKRYRVAELLELVGHTAHGSPHRKLWQPTPQCHCRGAPADHSLQDPFRFRASRHHPRI